MRCECARGFQDTYDLLVCYCTLVSILPRDHDVFAAFLERWLSGLFLWSSWLKVFSTEPQMYSSWLSSDGFYPPLCWCALYGSLLNFYLSHPCGYDFLTSFYFSFRRVVCPVVDWCILTANYWVGPPTVPKLLNDPLPQITMIISGWDPVKSFIHTEISTPYSIVQINRVFFFFLLPPQSRVLPYRSKKKTPPVGWPVCPSWKYFDLNRRP